MKPASLLAVLVFSLVASAHFVRLVSQTQVLVGDAVVPMWVSVLGLVIPGALALALWREARAARPEHAA